MKGCGTIGSLVMCLSSFMVCYVRVIGEDVRCFAIPYLGLSVSASCIIYWYPVFGYSRSVYLLFALSHCYLSSCSLCV